MTKLSTFLLAAITSAVFIGAGCSSETKTAAPNTSVEKQNSNAAALKKEEEIPAIVKAALPDAESFTTQHKDIPSATIAEIEKDTSAKVPDSDHHSYLAFAPKEGKKTQVGAATVVKIDGKDVVIVYENKDGSPLIKEIKAEGVAAEFLKQFIGKGHDDDLLLGADIKANGFDETKAKSFTESVRVDVLTMQALYGAAHTH